MLLPILILSVSVAYGDVSDFFVGTEAELAQFHTNFVNCVAETKVDPTLLKKIEMGQFARADDLNCFYGCYLLSDNDINKDGVINGEHLKKIFSPQVHGVIDYCLPRARGNDYCKVAYSAYKCFVTQSLKAKSRK